MFKKILSTISTRVMTTLMSFFIVVLNARYLGAEDLGTISLIVLGITILMNLNSIVGGGNLVYLIPRYNYHSLLTFSYLWVFAILVIFLVVMQFFNVFSTGKTYSLHIILLSFVLSFSKVNLNVLISKERIGKVNIINFLQVFLLFATIITGFFLFFRREIEVYIVGLYISYLTCTVLSFIFFGDHLPKPRFREIKLHLKKLVSYGFLIQLANLLQLLNYRVTYYIIDGYFQRSVLGVYSVGIQFAEALWLICRSLALVHFSRVSNTNDKPYAIRITLQFARASFMITILLVILLLCIPSSIFSSVLGNEFRVVPKIIAYLSISIISNSLTIMLTNYFLAVGKHHLNSVVNIAGLILTIGVGFILIPRYGYAGAGITTSVSFFTMLVIAFILFRRLTGTRAKDLLIRKEDFVLGYQLLRNYF
ncbi:MAG: polysaccharide biosynthesis C-terminal domain-containing protein [Bacteroidota bacterium]